MINISNFVAAVLYLSKHRTKKRELLIVAANFIQVNGETIVQRHEFAFSFQKFYQFVDIHVFGGAGVKMPGNAEPLDNGFFQAGFPP